MEYKGYTAKIEYSYEDNVIFGKIIGIVDSITFESTSTQEIEQEFKNAVDDYLEFCEEIGKSPDKPYKGQFNVRIAPELHRGMAMRAAKNNRTLNEEVEIAIREHLADKVDTQTTVFLPIIAGKTKSSFMNKEMWDDETRAEIAQTKININQRK